MYGLAPLRINRAIAPEMLEPDQARVLQNVECGEDAAVLKRGAGQSRVDFTTGVSTNVLRAFAGTRRDGVKFLLGYTEGGTLFNAIAPASAYEDADYE